MKSPLGLRVPAGCRAAARPGLGDRLVSFLRRADELDGTRPGVVLSALVVVGALAFTVTSCVMRMTR